MWIWRAGNYKKFQLAAAILTSIKKWTKAAGVGKQRVAVLRKTSEAKKKQAWLIIFLSAVCVCVFSIAKKISRSSWNPPTAMIAPGYLVLFRGLIPAVSVICWGRHAALPECYSVRAARGVRSVAAGRTAVSEGPSEDSPLKWGQTAEWQRRWTPGCTRSSICPHTRQKHIHLLKWFLVSYSAVKMDVPMICL